MTPKAQKRLNIILTDADSSRIERLLETTEAETTTELVKNALKFYEYFVFKKAEGSSFFIQQKDDESPTKIEFIGI